MSLGAIRICGLYPYHADLVNMPMRSYNDGCSNIKPCKFNMRYKFIWATVNGTSYLMSNIFNWRNHWGLDTPRVEKLI